MRRLVLTLTFTVLLVLNPGIVFMAGASPDGAAVDATSAALAVTTDELGLPVGPGDKVVQFAEVEASHRAAVAGLTWTGSEPGSVYFRTVIDGKKGAWSQSDVDPVDPSAPGNGKGGSDPWVVVGADTVQAAVVSSQAISATLTVYASPAQTTTTVGVAKAGAASSTYAWSNPQIYSRSYWGANESLVKNPYTYAKVTGAMIHHTSGSNTYTEADVPGILRSIQAYHVNGRGWNDIAYNFLIDKFGRAWEGRGGGVDKAVQGGHAWGTTNARVTGVSLIGNYETVTPSSVMLDTAERVIAWKFALHGVDAYGTTYGSGGQDGGSTFLNAISGHLDENATDCPGKYVYSQMSTIRAKVAAYIPQYKSGSAATSAPAATPTATATAPAPTANAGSDQSVTANSLVTLAGSSSVTGSTFAWSQTGGPTVSLSGASSAKATFTPSSVGAYTFSLKVTANGRSATDTVVVTVDAAGSVNAARRSGVTVTASSQDTSTGSTAAKAVDGVIDGYPGDETKEWTTLGGIAGSWIQLAFPTPVKLSRVALYDRVNNVDQVTGGTLTFSDGSTVAVGALNNAGGATSVSFSARTVTSVRFTVGSVASATENIGLAEFEAFGIPQAAATPTASATPTPTPKPTASAQPSTTPSSTAKPATPSPTAKPATPSPTAKPATTTPSATATPAAPSPTTSAAPPASGTDTTQGLVNLAPFASVSASSEDVDAGQGAANVVDGSLLGYPVDDSGEWATLGGGAGSTITLTWPEPVSLSTVVLYDRPNANDRVTGGQLSFSDGSSVRVAALSNAGATTVSFSERSVKSVTFTVTSVSARTENIGLAEFQAWGTGSTASAPDTPTEPPTQGIWSNLAPFASVSASSEDVDAGQGAANVVDGSLLGYPVDDSGEWATLGGGAGSTITLTWPEPVSLSTVVLYDRPNANDRVTGGQLSFSDGSSVRVAALSNAGATTVSFSERSVKSVTFTVTSVSASTENIGLAEFQAWGIAG